MDKTEVFRVNQTGVPYLAAFFAYGHIDDFMLTGRMCLGRAGDRAQAEIAVPVPSVSSVHGEFGSAKGRWFYRDRNSTNGSKINGRVLAGVHEMKDGDILTVVPREEKQGEPAFAGIFIMLEKGERLIWRRIPLKAGMEPVMIGRSQSGISPDDTMISRRHAVFKYAADGLSVLDEGSMNGVFVNGERCEARRLSMLDVIRMGRSWFVVTDAVLWEGEIQAGEQTDVNKQNIGADSVLKKPVPESVSTAKKPPQGPVSTVKMPAPRPVSKTGNSLMIDINESSVWKNFKKRVLLRNIHLTVDPGDMVLILGGSGAGKSTLIKSVMGYEQAEGTILYGNKNVYEDYEDMKRDIGYVPQQDLVRLSDGVEDTLMAAARIRMPGSSTSKEQTERVEWLLDILGLSEERDNLVGAISGGQKKRVSIGIELAADPALFFLDEPDSGLDGPTAESLMEMLRTIADLGKIVMVITHSPDRAFHLFTKIIVLGKTEDNVGHMLFFGTPQEALSFFETDNLEGIVGRINRVSEGGEGMADYFYDRYLRREAESGN